MEYKVKEMPGLIWYCVMILLFMMSFLGCKEMEYERVMNVRSDSIFDIGTHFATARASIIDNGNGITNYGHCWDTLPGTALNDSFSQLSNLKENGSFDSQIKNLLPGKTYFIKAYAQDQSDVVYSEEYAFTTYSKALPVVTTGKVLEVNDFGASMEGEIIDLGVDKEKIIAYGHCWNTKGMPTVFNDTVNLGTSSEVLNYISTIQLSTNTTYYVRAYATNKQGTAYGETVEIKTNDATPEVTTDPVNIDDVKASMVFVTAAFDAQSNVQISQIGVCYGLSPNPTVENDYIQETYNGGTQEIFSINRLSASTTYYVRAFIKSNIGITYGNEETFQTKEPTLPVLYDNWVFLGNNQVLAGAEIYLTGGLPVLNKGVCWSTEPEPTIDDNHVYSEDLDDDQNHLSINNLQTMQNYYIRSFAENDLGVGYNEEIVLSLPRENLFGLLEGVFMGVGTTLGSISGETDEQPVHDVQLTSIAISKYETTNAQYVRFLNDIQANTDGTYFDTLYINIGGENSFIEHVNGTFQVANGKEAYPVVQVSWFGARAYCRWMGGRLPTEAEWELSTKYTSANATFSGSNDLNNVGWYADNANGKIHEVGQKAQNDYSLYDLSGNVWEWCSDWYASDYYENSPEVDPTGPLTGTEKVIRGGAFDEPLEMCRNTNREKADPYATYPNIGFRFVMKNCTHCSFGD